MFIEEKFNDIFCLIAAKPVNEKWATCYNCHLALQVISHFSISGFLNKSISRYIPVGVCLKPDIPTNKLISIINFDLSQHIILCLTCLGDSFLATDGSLFTRCQKCLYFFENVEPDLDGMYWERFQGTDYDLHVASCKKQGKTKQISSHFTNPAASSLFARLSPKKSIKIKPFLLRKDQIK